MSKVITISQLLEDIKQRGNIYQFLLSNLKSDIKNIIKEDRKKEKAKERLIQSKQYLEDYFNEK